MKPKRIQRKRTKGWKMPPNTVYVGRPSEWWWPHAKGSFQEHPEELEQLYRADLDHKVVRKKLRGKNLCCYCPLDQPCHADILLEIANL